VPLGRNEPVPAALADCGLDGPGLVTAPSDRLVAVFVFNISADDQRRRSRAAANSPPMVSAPSLDGDVVVAPRRGTPPPVDRPYSPSTHMLRDEPVVPAGFSSSSGSSGARTRDADDMDVDDDDDDDDFDNVFGERVRPPVADSGLTPSGQTPDERAASRSPGDASGLSLAALTNLDFNSIKSALAMMQQRTQAAPAPPAPAGPPPPSAMPLPPPPPIPQRAPPYQPPPPPPVASKIPPVPIPQQAPPRPPQPAQQYQPPYQPAPPLPQQQQQLQQHPHSLQQPPPFQQSFAPMQRPPAFGGYRPSLRGSGGFQQPGHQQYQPPAQAQAPHRAYDWGAPAHGSQAGAWDKPPPRAPPPHQPPYAPGHPADRQYGRWGEPPNH
jgi:hypothetical protein